MAATDAALLAYLERNAEEHGRERARESLTHTERETYIYVYIRATNQAIESPRPLKTFNVGKL